MYKLIKLHKPNLPIKTSNNLADLFQMLDSPELKNYAPVIINEAGEIVAGHETAWPWAELKGFKVTA
jgi:hypothetical protein